MFSQPGSHIWLKHLLFVKWNILSPKKQYRNDVPNFTVREDEWNRDIIVHFSYVTTAMLLQLSVTVKFMNLKVESL